MYHPPQLLFLFFFFCSFFPVVSQPITGKWKTVDDKSGHERSVVEIFERNGKFFGKIVKLYRKPGEDPDPICDECDPDDDRYKKKIIGMEIIREMKKSGNEYEDGTVLDPESGKVYRAKLWAEGSELHVRGYWGPFYRTQTWRRVP
jgi:uncharacterized protein (DUF2147 family)